MKRRLLQVEAVAILAILIVSSLVAIAVTANGPGGAPATRAPGDTYLDIGSDTIPATVYPGDEVEWTFRLDENYNGEEWADDNDVAYPGGLAGWVYNVNIEIQSNANVPISWSARSVYIPDDPFNFTGNSWFNHNEDGDGFVFAVDTTNVAPGDYQISISVDYNIAVSYNYESPSPLDYNLTTWDTETLTIDFEVASCLDNEFDQLRTMSFGSTTGSVNAIYSGAVLQKIGFRAEAVGAIGQLRNTSITLNIPATGETAGIILSPQDPHSGNCYRRDLYNSWTYFYFYVNVANDVLPGIKEGAFLTVTYEREIDDVWTVITEDMDYDTEFMIDHTPLIDTPFHNNGLIPHITLNQSDIHNDKHQMLSVDITNTGNVDLISCDVEMYLEDSVFIDENRFYRLETSYNTVYSMDQTVELGTLNIGQTAAAVFDANFATYLPPGSYGIRLNYDLRYYDNGELGDSTQMVDSNENLYDNIQQVRGNTGTFYNYLYLILDIEDGDMDMFGYASQETPGSMYEQVQVTVVNYEKYGLTDTTVELNAGEFFEDALATPAAAPTGNGSGNVTPATTSEWIPLYMENNNNWNEYIPDANAYYDQDIGQYPGYHSKSFAFLVNVKDDISVTYGYTTMRIVGYDNYYQRHVVNLDVLCSFYPGNPNIYITNAYSSNSTGPGSKDVEYKVTVTNVGDSEARNMQFLLRCDYDVLIIQNPMLMVAGPLAPGESVTLTFIITFTDKARDAQYWNDQYTMQLSWGYESRDGEVRNLDSHTNTLYLKTSSLHQTEPVQQKQPLMSNDVSDLVTQIIWAIAVIAAAIVLMLGLFKLASGRKAPVQKKVQEPETQTEQPAEPEEEKEEEEEEELPPPEEEEVQEPEKEPED